MHSWVTQRGMQALQTSFHSYSFCFETVNRDVKNLFNSGIPYIQGWIRNACRGISRKRERMLLDFRSHFKFSFPQKLKLLNLRVWYMDRWNSVAKSFPTVSKRWSRNFFIFTNQRFWNFKRSIFYLDSLKKFQSWKRHNIIFKTSSTRNIFTTTSAKNFQKATSAKILFSKQQVPKKNFQSDDRQKDIFKEIPESFQSD